MQPQKQKNNYKSGKFAEFIAKFYLRLSGYRILKSRFVIGKGTGRGEIDIIAKRFNTVVFIEVKKRKTIETAGFSIFSTQQYRINKSAEAFLSQHNYLQNCNCRFDAILFNKFYLFKHIKNAWLT